MLHRWKNWRKSWTATGRRGSNSSSSSRRPGWLVDWTQTRRTLPTSRIASAGTSWGTCVIAGNVASTYTSVPRTIPWRSIPSATIIRMACATGRAANFSTARKARRSVSGRPASCRLTFSTDPRLVTTTSRIIRCARTFSRVVVRGPIASSDIGRRRSRNTISCRHRITTRPGRSTISMARATAVVPVARIADTRRTESKRSLVYISVPLFIYKLQFYVSFLIIFFFFINVQFSLANGGSA